MKYTENQQFRVKRASTLKLRMQKFVDDYGVKGIFWALALLMCPAVGAAWLLGGAQTPSLHHVNETIKLIKLDVFGGRQVVPRSINIYDDIQIFSGTEHNRLDIMATTLYVTATNFQKELRSRLDNPEAQIRIIVLDPLLVNSDPQLFQKLAQSFHQSTGELWVEALHSYSALDSLRKELGAKFLVRFYSCRLPSAPDGYLIPARSYHSYDSVDPENRFDIIVPYGDPKSQGQDSPNRSAIRFKNIIKDPLIKQHVSDFQQLWEQSTPIEAINHTIHEQWLNFPIVGGASK